MGNDDISLNTTVICCYSSNYGNIDSFTSLVATRNALWLISLAVLPDGEAAMVSDLQAYLWCRKLHCSTPPRLTCVWDAFYDRCKKLIRRVVVKTYPELKSSGLIEDIVQEVWHEVVIQLPKLAYDPRKGSFFAWLTGLVETKTRRLLRTFIPDANRRAMAVDLLEERLHANGMGPEESYLFQEMCNHLSEALVRFRQKVSAGNYEVFCQRFFLQKGCDEIAASSGLSVKAIYRRCDRMKEQWRRVTNDFPLSEYEDELNLAAAPPLQITPL